MILLEKEIDGFKVVSIQGRLDANQVNEIEEKLLYALKTASKGLIIDLKELSYLSSGGMRLFVKLTKEAKKLKLEMSFIELSTEVKETLEITGFLPFLHTFADMQSALISMKESYWSNSSL